MQLSAQELQQLRQASPPQSGLLWQALMQRANSDLQVLSTFLMDSHGLGLLYESEIDQWKVDAFHSTPIPHAQVVRNGLAYLVFEDPWSTSAVNKLARVTQPNCRLGLVSPAALRAFQERAANSDSNSTPSAVQKTGAPSGDAVSFVSQALEQGYADGASDIHFESDRSGIRTKFRIDGVMCPGKTVSSVQFAEQVISRIKVLASLDITERRKPQDGRFRWTSQSSHATDMRVSIMPSIFGEDAVLRLLDRAQLRDGKTGISLPTLGFDESTSKVIRGLASKPHGMLLVTGPTGSGKTTTIYAALSEVNNQTEKIITIEDPVEYELPGVLQIPVNEQKGLTFATGLRSILRHDPDKILVGEIRDSETAEIAIQAALTGHLVFTTVHANSLFDVLGRFQHFGVDPFALASALNGVLVQRLLRKLCPDCKDPSPPEVSPIPMHRLGCPTCRHTGYKGRLVIAEVLLLDNPLRDLIIQRASISEISDYLNKRGDKQLLEIAKECVSANLTSMEEVERVIGLA